MLVLALDTSTRQGSAALVRGRTLVGVQTGDPGRTHGERLPGDLQRLLTEHGYALPDVDLFAVAAGPGSFTGLRVGIATIQGLAFATKRPVVGVSVLEAVAQMAAGWDGFDIRVQEASGTEIGVLLDAQRREVFSARYRLVRSARADGEAVAPAVLEELGPPTAEAPDVTLARWAARPVSRLVLAGDGVALYGELVARHLGRAALLSACLPLAPLAQMIAVLGTHRAASGRAGSPAAVRPIYVRRPDAELARDRQATRTPGEDRP
jgi:tRNA threonylcarbamoyladenosine biosynthesis protein TsaB